MNYKALQLISEHLQKNKIIYHEGESKISYYLNNGEIKQLTRSLYKVSPNKKRIQKKYLKVLGNDILKLVVKQIKDKPL